MTAYAYSGLVTSVLEGWILEEQQIEHILDGILDFAGDERFQELFKKLCCHIYGHYPRQVIDYITMYKHLYGETGDADETTLIRSFVSRPLFSEG